MAVAGGLDPRAAVTLATVAQAGTFAPSGRGRVVEVGVLAGGRRVLKPSSFDQYS